jgi:hypothetical protein
MAPINYCVELAEGRIAPPANLDIATIQEQELAMMFRFHVDRYLSRRAADWRERGFTEGLTGFAALQGDAELQRRRDRRANSVLWHGSHRASPGPRDRGTAVQASRGS